MKDPRLLYAYHMYEPWSATSAPNMKRAKPYRYPGVAPLGGKELEWDASRVEAYLQQPIDWAQQTWRAHQPDGGGGVRLHAPVA